MSPGVCNEARLGCQGRPARGTRGSEWLTTRRTDATADELRMALLELLRKAGVGEDADLGEGGGHRHEVLVVDPEVGAEGAAEGVGGAGVGTRRVQQGGAP